MNQTNVFLSIIAALTLSGQVALAQSGFMSDPYLILNQDQDEVIMTFERSWICSALGEPENHPDLGLRDKHGVPCPNGPDARINPYNAGVNFGLIERLEAVGFDHAAWREALADPEQLRVFAETWANGLHLLIVSGTSGKFSARNIIDTETGEMSKYFARDMYEFVARRQAEAKPSDRAEVAQLWNSIIADQFARYKAYQETVPDFTKE